MKLKVCATCRERKPLEGFGLRSRSKDGRQSSCSPCSRKNKREQRARRADRPVEPKGSIYGLRVPAERLASVIMGWRENRTMSTLSGSALRRVWSICNEQEFVQFDTADKLLIELGLDNLWHVSPEHGGLADFYHHEDYDVEVVDRLDNLGGWCLRKRAPVPTAPGLGGLSAGDAKRRGTDGGRFVPKTPPASLSRRGRSSLERTAA